LISQILFCQNFVPVVSGLLASAFAGSDLEQLLVSAPLLISVPAIKYLVAFSAALRIRTYTSHCGQVTADHAIATTTCNKL